MERKLENNASEAIIPLRKFGRCPPVRCERKKKNRGRHGQFSEEKGEWSGRTHALKDKPVPNG
jgi:hypothetical protein